MKRRRLLSTALAVVMTLALAPAAWAAEGTGFADVRANAWYAGAVQYVSQNNLMDGMGATVFSPNTNTDRATLATALYRASGSPAVTQAAGFTDVAADAGYAAAATWAAENGIVSGYADGRFGAADSITREQIAAILWRYSGKPESAAGQDFADETSISAYAASAVDWARANGIVNGKEGNRFDPKGNTTRAEMATILRNYLSADQPEQPPMDSGSNVLVAYYSATGSTEAVAEQLADVLEADLFEITPKEPYTSEDLNWTDDNSRVSREHEDESLRTVELESTTVENWADYDTVFVGYPIWWGIAAWPVDGFVRANDFTGKTVIPFCTSSSSGLGESGRLLAELAGTGNWQEGQRFRSSASGNEVSEWANSLQITAKEQQNIPVAEGTAAQTSKKPLVVYFSMPETANAENMTTEEDNSVVVINGQVLGNTQYMAQVIAEAAGADIFRIEPETPYPTDHTTLVDLASEEQEEDARPAIKGRVQNMEQYDTIFIGYPIWWSDMPMILYTFFDTYDLRGKTIIPFSTHGGSSFAGTPSTIARLEPDAEMREGLTISRNQIEDAEREILDWVNRLEAE